MADPEWILTGNREVSTEALMTRSPDGALALVGGSNPLPVRFGDSASLDATGNLKVATPTTVFSSAQEYSFHPLLFEHVTAGTGSATHSTLRNSTTLRTGGAADGARAFRQSKVYWRYQEGKGQIAKITSVPLSAGVHAGGSKAHACYGDDRNGVMLRTSAAGPSMVIRSDTSGSVVENEVVQAAWNLDTLDGAGPSGITLDVTKSQYFIIDLAWLSVGRVRVGFQIDRANIFVHEFLHTNRTVGAYMRTANLPVRWEVVNDGAGADISMEAICVAIESAGGVQDVGGYTWPVGTKGVQVACPATEALTPIFTIRLRDTFNGLTYRGHVRPFNLGSLVSGNGAYWELLWNATLTGATFEKLANSEYSGVEYDTAATAVTGGFPVEADYFGAGAGSNRLSNTGGLSTKLLLARTLGNVRDTMTLAARGVGGVANVAASIDFTEVY